MYGNYNENLFCLLIDKLIQMCYNLNKAKELRQLRQLLYALVFTFYSIFSRD